MRKTGRNEKGSTLIEFTLVGISLIFMFISLIEMCMTMWSYHTLAYAVREGARYASTKGQGCTRGTNSCSVTVAAVAQQIASTALGLIPGQLNIDLVSAASDVPCHPLSNCYSNPAIWPPSSNSANVPGSAISVSGSYPVQTALIFMFFPTTGVSRFGASTVSASSQQIVQF